MRLRWLLASLLLPSALFASPSPVELPSGLLLAESEGATYTVGPDSALVAQSGLLSYYPPGLEPLWPVIHAPSSALQGDEVSILVASLDPIDDLRAVLRSPQGAVVVRGRGFELPVGALGADPRADGVAGIATAPGVAADQEPAPLSPGSAQVRVYAVLMGAPSDAAPGSYRLELHGASAGRSFSFAGRVDLRGAEFAETRVKLDSALTSLRTQSNDRTAREQARLDAAVRSFTPSAVFNPGSFRPPLEKAAPLSAGFGDRRVYLYSNGSTASTTHRGLDLAAAAGTPVLACGRGRVVLVEDMLVTGKTIAIEHLPGVVSFYFHLSATKVVEGQEVEPGAVIGLVGSTGLATGPHLHWETRIAGVAVHPRTDRELVDKSAVIRIIADCQSQRR